MTLANKQSRIFVTSKFIPILIGHALAILKWMAFLIIHVWPKYFFFYIVSVLKATRNLVDGNLTYFFGDKFGGIRISIGFSIVSGWKATRNPVDGEVLFLDSFGRIWRSPNRKIKVGTKCHIFSISIEIQMNVILWIILWEIEFILHKVFKLKGNVNCPNNER